jgi:excinuclease ABC subunit C
VREEYFAEQKGKQIAILSPQRGDKRQLVEMAAENARQSFAERHDQEKAREKMLRELQAQLRLRTFRSASMLRYLEHPRRHAVGSMVTFVNGEPDNRATVTIAFAHRSGSAATTSA